ncbi:2-dehydropantoate 2-reductase [Streptomyces sp. SAI-117]|uniref:ketopantoate reductase family protein n=1 Tax=unclassified Streptomyces TaxID=2593676 RepID=UPI002473B411|nr:MULTISPECIES: 2-dehydropantoate 2-reductase [unclassified Streptomyces]MDH6553968.1 2-dehydropantoate 2-reductase [Streptomyces sp. SAI-041]MDH6573046.1 2-dehydropantoate 2-reductase [Streptomyces sp. SAI-117]MDH6581992.1 2-dehydropantoate 2-reductase [Streptomyces sp. SAI-133]
MKILIVGAGAVGGFLGGRLVGAGRQVDFLVRPKRAAQLRETGLRIVDGEQVERFDASFLTADELTSPYDLILLCVKPDALPAVLDDLAPAVGRGTAAVPLLNGMGHVDLLTERYPQAVLGGVVKIVTQLEANGDVRQLLPGGQILIGELNGVVSERVEAAAQALAIPDFDVTALDNIVDAMWSKWVMIATIGAITSLVRGTISDAAAVQGGAAFATRTLDEAASVAAAARHPLSESERASYRELVAAAALPLTSSLSRELLAGRTTEVDNVLGDLINRAHAFGLAVPRLEAAALTLRAHNARAAAAS